MKTRIEELEPREAEIAGRLAEAIRSPATSGIPPDQRL